MPETSHFGGVNLPGLLSVMLILVVAFAPVLFGRRGPASEQDDGDTDDDGGGPGGPPPPSRPTGPPSGGIPLDDAQPARMRLRTHERLAERRRVGGGDRRRSREPERAPAVVDRQATRT
ncbi:MAG: hypothetical protein ACXVFQ_09360 [Solirubrobacteraceae bacterium]